MSTRVIRLRAEPMLCVTTAPARVCLNTKVILTKAVGQSASSAANVHSIWLASGISAETRVLELVDPVRIVTFIIIFLSAAVPTATLATHLSSVKLPLVSNIHLGFLFE